MIWGNPPKLAKTKPKPAKIITPEDLAKSGNEDGHQMALFCWAAQNMQIYPQLRMMFAIPNGGSRHIAEASKMVGAGVKAGVPDIFLASPKDNGSMSQSYSGLFIEMKKTNRRNHKNGGQSKDQINWIHELKMNNYACAICYTWIEARDTILKYLNGDL